MVPAAKVPAKVLPEVAEAAPEALFNFLRKALSALEIRQIVDALREEDAFLYQLVLGSVRFLKLFGSDELVVTVLNHQPEAVCGAALGLSFIRILTLLQTLVVPLPGNAEGLLFWMHFEHLHESAMLYEVTGFTPKQGRTFCNKLLGLYLETS